MSLEEEVNRDAFRDRIATIDESGNRNWIFAKKPSGRFYKWRTWVSIGLLSILFAGPFIHIAGRPLFMFNVIERKFVLFGQVFWPQDFFLFVVGMLTSVVFIILFTVAFGRLFCGWVCPQTIFMEMVFRKLEYWIEGDFQRQRKLDKMAWNREKITKRLTKHSLFFIISFLIANTLLAYIIGRDELFLIITDNPENHVAGLSSMLIFTGVFYGVFARFREQVCTVVCPYGRLQGVLLDRDSIIVAYDWRRGEKRARFKRREVRADEGKGDCIDCHACVDVCPTGIDIRNGTQMECINCTACIDACDAIMDKLSFDRGLIRYASENQIEAGRKKITITNRTIAYSSVLGLLLSVLLVLFALRTDVETTILRTPGMLYEEVEPGLFRNFYNYKVINKTHDALVVNFQMKGDGRLKVISGQPIQVPEEGYAEGTVVIYLSEDELNGQKTSLEIEVIQREEVLETLETSFVGPI